MTITIGIPKSFLYYKYKDLWKSFFTELGCNVVYSPETNKDILEKGKSFLVDESCLSMKIHMGHINSLINKCDYILIPHIQCLEKNEEVCTNFYALYDLAKNIFNTKIISYHVDLENDETEEDGFIKMGIELGFKKKKIMKAYKKACEQRRNTIAQGILENKNKLKDKKTLKILLVGHPYNVHDEFVGKPIINLLEKLNINIIYSHFNDANMNAYKKVSKTLYWTFNKELVNGIVKYQDNIDGVILISTFPCGPDSLVNELLIRTINIPIISLVIDELNSNTGLETRIESFVDILSAKKKVIN